MLRTVVLLADDDAACRGLFARHLQDAGYEVCEADDGVEALSRLFRWQIDVLVTDLRMPRIGGLLLTSLAQVIQPGIPVVAYSGVPPYGDALKELARTQVQLLQKPFGRAALVAAVERVKKAGTPTVTHSPAEERTPTRILVVDDDTDGRLTLRTLLECHGYEVMEASDGQKALAVIAEGDVSLVITDVVMPELEGTELIQRVHGDNPSIKIIAVSGNSHALRSGYLVVARHLGANRTFTKPVEPRNLLRAVEELVGSGTAP